MVYDTPSKYVSFHRGSPHSLCEEFPPPCTFPLAIVYNLTIAFLCNYATMVFTVAEHLFQRKEHPLMKRSVFEQKLQRLPKRQKQAIASRLTALLFAKLTEINRRNRKVRKLST